jgi:hypothetical protein
MKLKLKPCPWCGNNSSHMNFILKSGQYQRVCIICRTPGPAASKKSDANELWNIRSKVGT